MTSRQPGPLRATLYGNDREGGERLRPGSIHVWRFSCAGLAEAEREKGLALISPEERRRSLTFVKVEHQESFLTQRVFVRTLLSHYVGATPRALQFQLSVRGKPFLPGAGNPQFNLSHATDEALLAIAMGFSVGVDLERVDADIDPVELRPTVLAPGEAALLAGLAGLDKKRAFLRIWCRKEACLKAAGIGLLDDLTAVSVDSDRVDLRRCADRQIDPERAPVVYLQDLQLGEAHVAALATTAPCAPVARTPLLERTL